MSYVSSGASDGACWKDGINAIGAMTQLFKTFIGINDRWNAIEPYITHFSLFRGILIFHTVQTLVLINRPAPRTHSGTVHRIVESY